jgi:nucleotide-binding universal stress UspA family protein
MIKFRKILLPVDGSKNSRLAKQNAISLATALESEILLVYITGALPAIITGKPREEALKSQKEEADQVLEPYRKFLAEHRITYKALVVPGFNPGDEICRIAQDETCDLIVMGSRGLSDLEGMVMGSVTHRVLTRCTIPVLVVR